MTDLLRDILTPSPGATPYQAGVMAMAHAMLGAALCASLGWYGLAPGLAAAALYWLVKERGDLRRGGAIMDGLEDAVMVWLGSSKTGGAWMPKFQPTAYRQVNVVTAFGGDGYYINGTKVVTTRQSAIADATDGTEVTTINSILTALRQHGLIAT